MRGIPVRASGAILAGRVPDRALASLVWRLAPAGVFVLLALLVFAAMRADLLVQLAPRVAAGGGALPILAGGLRFDGVVICGVLVLVLLGELLLPAAAVVQALWAAAVRAWLTAWLMLITFNEAATPAFMAEFGVRPNRQYVEYLDTPGVVWSTIWQGNRAALLTGIVMMLAAGGLGWRVMRPRIHGGHGPAWYLRILVLLPLLVAVGYGVRGSVGHRPISVSNAVVSTDPAVNTLMLNSTYSALHALYQLRGERVLLAPSGTMAEADMLARVRRYMQVPELAFTDPDRPTRHLLVPSVPQGRNPNLIILLQESLGAEYVGSLGGEPVAEHIERWRGRSLWFDRLYASGIRSARGIEAVVTGFLPTRTSSLIKLEGAQHDTFTIARALKSQGYRTTFIYGGDASFDNMRRFFLGNGFDRVIDQADLMPEAGFSTTWGVSDEDLYARVQHEAEVQAADGQPFFLLVFSTSNHPPFDFPDNRIQLYESPKQTRPNAARYADQALDRYLAAAEVSPYWENTVFTVVADHASRTLGEELVPVLGFHIPGFITGGPVAPRVVSRLASQIDLLPTTLSLMGLSVEIPATGLDQSRTDLVGPGYAVLQFNDNAALWVGDEVLMRAPGVPARQFRVEGNTLVAVATDPELAADAVAMSMLPLYAYAGHWYR